MKSLFASDQMRRRTALNAIWRPIDYQVCDSSGFHIVLSGEIQRKLIYSVIAQ